MPHALQFWPPAHVWCGPTDLMPSLTYLSSVLAFDHVYLDLDNILPVSVLWHFILRLQYDAFRGSGQMAPQSHCCPAGPDQTWHRSPCFHRTCRCPCPAGTTEVSCCGAMSGSAAASANAAPGRCHRTWQACSAGVRTHHSQHGVQLDLACIWTQLHEARRASPPDRGCRRGRMQRGSAAGQQVLAAAGGAAAAAAAGMRAGGRQGCRRCP